jgi:hypothetical protein
LNISIQQGLLNIRNYLIGYEGHESQIKQDWKVFQPHGCGKVLQNYKMAAMEAMTAMTPMIAMTSMTAMTIDIEKTTQRKNMGPWVAQHAAHS